MKHHKRSFAKFIGIIMVVLFLVLPYTIQFTHAQASGNDKWALNFQIMNAQNATSTTFAPFDEIKFSANVTYSNASQPDILVTFKVQGPTESQNPINITRIATTSSSGEAECSFFLPIMNQNNNSVTGTWQTTATIRTSNGTIQQNQDFTTQWKLEIKSISIKNSQNQNQSIFYPGNTCGLLLELKNNGPSQTANITLTMQDSTGKVINQTQIENTQVETTTTNSTQIQSSIQIPNSALTGESTITGAIYAGNYNYSMLPAGENKTAYFTITGNIAPSTTAIPTPSPTVENAMGLFSWLLVATGLFTFTALFMFLKRKTIPGINTQIPITPAPTSNQITTTLPPQLLEQQPTGQTALLVTPTAKVASEKTVNATLPISLPSIYETLNMPTSESTNPQEQKQIIINQLTKISSASQRVQALESALKIEREQLSKEIATLTKTLEEQERAVKNYFDTIKEEIAKLNSNPNSDKEENAPSQNRVNQQLKKDGEN